MFLCHCFFCIDHLAIPTICSSDETKLLIPTHPTSVYLQNISSTSITFLIKTFQMPASYPCARWTWLTPLLCALRVVVGVIINIYRWCTILYTSHHVECFMCHGQAILNFTSLWGIKSNYYFILEERRLKLERLCLFYLPKVYSQHMAELDHLTI